mmetsp:Transcript_23994/g.42835  ORF Transcript_23994/g.42835 Transcript_23994/m.42835 type:complete len:370 (+) Transcript_23994:1182-2291(+)
MVPEHVFESQIQDVGHGVIGSDFSAAVVIDLDIDFVSDGNRPLQDISDMEDITRGDLGITDIKLGPPPLPITVITAIFKFDNSSVSDLATALRVEAGGVENHAPRTLLFLGSAVDGVDKAGGSEDGLDLGGERLGPVVFGQVVGERDGMGLEPPRGFGLELETPCRGLLAAGATLLAGRFEGGVVSGEVYGQSALLRHQLGEINGESKGVPELKGLCAPDLPTFRSGDGGLLEALNPLDQSATEAGLLFANGLVDDVTVLHQFGEESAKLAHHYVHELRKEALLTTEGFAAVADGATEDTTEDVITSIGSGTGPISNGEGKRADVVSHNTIGHVDAVRIVLADLVGVGASAGELLDLVEDGGEDVGGVV